MIRVALLYAFSAPCWIPLTKGKLCHLLLPEQTIEQWMTMAMKRHSLAKLYKKISQSYKYAIQLRGQQLSRSTMKSQFWQLGAEIITHVPQAVASDFMHYDAMTSPWLIILWQFMNLNYFCWLTNLLLVKVSFCFFISTCHHEIYAEANGACVSIYESKLLFFTFSPLWHVRSVWNSLSAE